MPNVTFTVDGKKLTAPAGTLLIEACREASERGERIDGIAEKQEANPAETQSTEKYADGHI